MSLNMSDSEYVLNNDWGTDIERKNKTKEKRKKYLCYAILILSIVSILIAILLFILLPYRGGKIITKYETTKENEEVQLINTNDDITFRFFIGDIDYKGNKTYCFERAGIHTVIFEFKSKMKSLDGLFRGITNLIEIDFSELITEEITSMSSTFAFCSKLNKVNINNTMSNLENLSYMFFSCESLNNVNLIFDTSKVTRMDFTFYDCPQLVNLDISNFNLENITTARNMFAFSSKLKEIKFKENTITNNLEEITEIFSHCESLEKINTKIFKIDKVKNLNYVFEDCYSLTELDLSNFQTRNIEEAIGTFKNCRSLKSIDISNFNLSNLKKAYRIFYNCINLINLNISSLSTNELYNINEAFYNCQSLKSLDLSSFNFAKIITMSKAFYNCVNLENLILPDNMNNLIKTDNTFENCYNLNSINLNFLQKTSYWITSEGMFKNCSKLKGITIPSVIANTLDSTKEMFSDCINLESIDLKELQANKITSLSKMFFNCKQLGNLNIYNFNTKNAVQENFADIFEGSKEIIKITYNSDITHELIEKEIKKKLNITSETIL